MIIFNNFNIPAPRGNKENKINDFYGRARSASTAISKAASILILSILVMLPLCGPAFAADKYKAEKYSELNDAFRRRSGFLGGDGFYNIPLSKYKSLVIFGDTLTGKIAGGKREFAGMPHNSPAIFHHRPGMNGKMTYGAEFFIETPLCPFLENNEKNRYFWPLDGLLSNGKLYIFGAQVEMTKANDAFGFKECGNYIFSVDNPEFPIKMWNKKLLKATPAKFGKNSYLIWGSSVVRHDGYIYIYGVYSFKSTKSLVMARVAEQAFEDLSAWEYYSNGQFIKGVMPSPLFDGIANEFSVIFDQASGKFRIVYTLNSMGADIVMRVSDSPVFTSENKPEVIYRCPENGMTRNIFTYSAKAVKALCDDKRLVVVYFTNSFDVNDPINNATIYWPEFVEIKL